VFVFYKSSRIHSNARIARMKLRLLFLLAVAAAINLAAQSTKDVPVTSEPHHHLVLHNKYVRVFKVDVPSQQATLMHRHEYDYAYVTIGPTELINQVEGKPATDLKLQDGETRFSPGPFAHLIRVLAPAPFRNVTIEFLHGNRSAKSSSSKWVEDRGLQILTGGTEDILFVKDDVRVSDVQLNPDGMLPENQTVAAELIVAVSDIQLRAGPGHQQQEEVIALSAGDIRWLHPGRTLVNADNKSARFICLEFHEKHSL